MKRYFLCFLLLLTPLLGAEKHLKEQILKAQGGDYIVFEGGKTVTLLHLRSIAPNSLIFEEISAPLRHFQELPPSWKGWVEERAPGHTSWSMIEIDPSKGEVVECYSFSKGGWVSLSPQESLLVTLLEVPLTPVEASEWRRIGPPPPPGEPDFRKVWLPPLVYEGIPQKNVRFDLYETIWPNDGGELSGKRVTLYFDREGRSPLPFWIEVQTTHATAPIQAIDAGKGLHSPISRLPRRAPQFAAPPQRSETGLRLFLKSPKYYETFELFAIDVTNEKKKIVPLSHSVKREKGDLVILEIEEAELRENFEPGHAYTWLVAPVNHADSYAESFKPFVWKIDDSLTRS